MWRLLLYQSLERCFIVLKGQQLLVSPLPCSSLPLLVSYGGNCRKTLLLFFIFKLLISILKCLTAYKPLWCFLWKSETTLTCLLCSLMIPWGLTPLLHWFTCTLDCLACRSGEVCLMMLEAWYLDKMREKSWFICIKALTEHYQFGVFSLRARSS